MKKILLATLLVLPLSAQAQDVRITKICDLQASGTSAHLKPCEGWTAITAQNGGWITWSLATYGGRAMFALAMNAKNKELSVTVRIDTTKYEYYDVTKMVRENRS